MHACICQLNHALCLQVTALWVTHRLEELAWADGVSYMDAGRIQFSGSPQEAVRRLRGLGARVPELGVLR
jgi:ABC-type transport system involved in cytochrome bd biosynthesis fused ATPase/permease subunit